MPYSFGKPTLNCCGGSLSTLGNMNRPVAASAAADAAENAPQARPSHARRVKSGDESSGSRVAAFAAAGAGTLAARPPGDAALVVRPVRSGSGAAGLGGAAGRAACAAAAGAAGVAAAAGVPGAEDSGLLSSAMFPHAKLTHYPITFSASIAASLTFKLRSFRLSAVTDGLNISSFNVAAARNPLMITSAIGSSSVS